MQPLASGKTDCEPVSTLYRLEVRPEPSKRKLHVFQTVLNACSLLGGSRLLIYE